MKENEQHFQLMMQFDLKNGKNTSQTQKKISTICIEGTINSTGMCG